MSATYNERRRGWARVSFAWLVGIAAAALACEGPPGPPGSPGAPAEEPDASSDSGPVATIDAAPDTADALPAPSYVATGAGLMLAISQASIDPSGKVLVTFTVTDGSGIPLDYAGVYTQGAVNAKWVISALSQGPDDGGAPPAYAAYTTQPHTSADGTKTAALPGSDTGGTLTEIGVGQGTYTYAFGTKLPAGFDTAATHTIGVWATRVFGGLTYVVNTLYDFVPGGGAVAARRDIATTQACNQCHNPLGYHEGDTARRQVGLCILCHATPAVDVGNGNALDMPVMIHKIHQGRFLPSVLDGGTYRLTEDVPSDAGGDGSATVTTLVDHSGAWYPAGQVQNCAMCHQGSQGSVWTTAPSRAACGACHDRTSFVYPAPPGWTLHPGGQQLNDSTCLNSGCHGPADHYGVASVHLTPSTDPSAPVLALTITGVAGTDPGQVPVLSFSVTQNGAPLDVLATPLPWLAVTIAGPTTDYAQSEPTIYPIENGTAQPGLVQGAAVGSYVFTFPDPIPSSATGSYAIGMEGYLQPGGSGGSVYAALNPVTYVAVTDPAPVPRRTVVERSNCDSCHYDLLAHGGTRKSPEYCVMCHTPSEVDDQNAPRFEVPATTVPSVSFKVLVHKVHRGSQLAQGYVVGGYPAPTPAAPEGTPVDFGKVLYPGDQRACWACHASTSYLPPLPSDLLPTVSQEVLACTDSTLIAGAYCSNRVVESQSLISPLSAACTACHDDPASVAHAQANTAPDGAESCTVCHGAGQPWAVQTVHTLPP
jgi:OmcA/MtrC family decaheme c-type cytochrome